MGEVVSAPVSVQVWVELPEIHCVLDPSLVPAWLTVEDLDVLEGDVVLGSPSDVPWL